jgi:hypothetical protein
MDLRPQGSGSETHKYKIKLSASFHFPRSSVTLPAQGFLVVPYDQ